MWIWHTAWQPAFWPGTAFLEYVRRSGAMPLWKGQPYAAAQPALGLQNDVPVLLIRFTGEVFQYYECVSGR